MGKKIRHRTDELELSSFPAEDGDGRISSDELGVVLKALGRKPPGAKPRNKMKSGYEIDTSDMAREKHGEWLMLFRVRFGPVQAVLVL